MKKAILAIAASVAVAGPAWAQMPVGPELQVNTYTTGAQRAASVDRDAAGNFVVVWHSLGQDGDDLGVFGQRFAASGTPLGPEFRVSSYTAYFQEHPDVAMAPDGSFVVVWSGVGSGPFGTDVWLQRYDAAGAPLGGNVRVNTNLSVPERWASVASDAAGRFVVAWASLFEDGDGYAVWARTFGAGGSPGPVFAVNVHTTGDQTRPSVAANASGEFVVSWESSTQDGSGAGIRARRYDSTGLPVTGELPVNTFTAGDQLDSSVAIGPAGNFMVTWSSDAQDGSYLGVFGQAFDAAGSPVGGEFQANSFSLLNQSYPGVASTANGDFLVVWSDLQDPSGGIYGRRFDATGVPADAEFHVNTYTPYRQGFPAISGGAAGKFVVAWDSAGAHDGSSYGIFAQAMASDLIFEDGFESGSLTRWSNSATDGGDLGVTGAAALDATTFGLQGFADDTAPLYVADETPENEDRYRARFYFDPNDFDPGQVLSHLRTRIMLVLEEAPTRRVAAVVLRRQGSAYSVMVRARADDNSQVDTGFFPISAGEHALEIDWRRATTPSANDGSLQFWIDGSLTATLGNLDNNRSSVDFVRLGALSVKTGATGTLYWDEFESRRVSYIGP